MRNRLSLGPSHLTLLLLIRSPTTTNGVSRAFIGREEKYDIIRVP